MNPDHKILLVDDNLKPLQGHIQLLRSNGYAVETAETGEAGYNAAIDGCPHLILLDVVLPDTDGFEICRRLKQSHVPRTPYIVMFSGRETDPRSLIRGLEIGADDYLAKPIAKEVLLARINAMFRTIKAEEALMESERKFRSAFFFSGTVMAMIDLDGKFLEINQALMDFLGYTPDEMLKKTLFDITHTEDLKGSIHDFRRLLTGEYESYSAENRYVHKTGKTLWGILTVSKIRDENSSTAYCIAQLNDISRRVEAEKKLEAERKRLNVTLRSIGDGVITTDQNGKVALINKVGEDLTGWRRRDALGKPLEKVFHIVDEKTRKSPENPHLEILETGSAVEPGGHTVLVSRDGVERIVEQSGAPIRDRAGNVVGVVIVFRDITERIQIESELRQAHKMESIGTLAGGIAHEFNNVMSIILGNSSLALHKLPVESPIRNNIEDINSAVMRAKDVVRQLLTFSRLTHSERETIDIGPVVKESVRLIRSSIPANIDIVDRISSKLDKVKANASQIHQVMINLCGNAADAMSERGGTLSIRLVNAQIDEAKAARLRKVAPGDYVKLAVGDTGVGMDKETMERIFEPYFTTKEFYKGTGMGLASVHGIVEQHKGAILVDSKPGKGTVFTLLFPKCEEEKPIEVPKNKKLPTGQETILVIDDEVVIMKLCKQQLERLGYRVKGTSNPLEALALFQADPNRYDLVVTDMAMPCMAGDELSAAMLKIRPDIPIILCTGFSEKISEEKALALGMASFALKPIDWEDFAVTVRKAIDKAAA